jgi:hypothetical protein
VLAKGALSTIEVAQRIKEATGSTQDLDFVYPVPGHPAMRLNASFIEFVSFFGSRSQLIP